MGREQEPGGITPIPAAPYSWTGRTQGVSNSGQTQILEAQNRGVSELLPSAGADARANASTRILSWAISSTFDAAPREHPMFGMVSRRILGGDDGVGRAGLPYTLVTARKCCSKTVDR